MTTLVQAPYEFFTDRKGRPLDSGFVYIGVENQDPQTSPQACYWDDALTLPAAQPLRTTAGYIVNPDTGGSPAQVFTANAYSIRVRERLGLLPGVQAFFAASRISDYGKLIAQLMASTGAGLIGFIQTGVGAVARTLLSKGRDIVSAEDFGAVGDGTTDNATALANALATGKLVWLQKGQIYAYGSQLNPPDNGGFVGDGTLHMLTGAGKFDASSYGSGFASNKVGIYVNGKANVRIEAKHTMQANGSVRVCSPVSVRSSTNVTVMGEVSGFAEAEFPLLNWDSNTGGYVRWYAHDCTPNSTSLGSMQLTGFGVDYNRIAGANSLGLIFDVTVRNLRLGPAARQQYGEQSDAVNIQSQGFSGAIGRVYGETVGEVLDLFGDGCNINATGRAAYAYGVKLIHGASNNVINATIDYVTLYALVYGGSNTANKEVANNIVTLAAAHVGELPSSVLTVTTNNTTTINVTAITGINLTVGTRVRGPGIPPNSVIASFGTGTGGTGTYVLNNAATTGAVGVTLNATPGITAAVATDGTGATYKPQRNATTVKANGDDVNMDYIVYEESGRDDTYVADGAGYAIQMGFIAGTAQPGNIIRRQRNTHVRAYIGTATTVTNNATVAYDTELVDATGEYNPATGICTVRCAGRYLVRAQVRAPSVASNLSLGLAIQRNGSTVVRSYGINYGSGAGELQPPAVEAIADCDAGDQLKVICVTSSGSPVTITNQAEYSFLYIEQL